MLYIRVCKPQYKIFHKFVSLLVQRWYFFLSWKYIGNFRTLIFPCRHIKFHQRHRIHGNKWTCYVYSVHLTFFHCRHRIGDFQYHFVNRNFAVNPTTLNFIFNAHCTEIRMFMIFNQMIIKIKFIYPTKMWKNKHIQYLLECKSAIPPAFT